MLVKNWFPERRKCIRSNERRLYCSILLHFSLHYDQFTVLSQFYKFTFKILKLLKFLKVLKITTCFGQYSHHQVLKSSVGNCCYSALIACVPLMRTCVVRGVSCSLLYSVALISWFLYRRELNILSTVAYLRHARTVTSKHAPTITQE
jgi:hypothetical protein